MSITAINWARQQKTGTPLRKLVLFMLANYADQWAFAWPTQPTLASICQVDERSVRRALNELEEQKKISKITVRMGRSPRVLYRLDCESVDEIMPPEHPAVKFLTRTKSPPEKVHPDSDAVHPDSDDSSPGLTSPGILKEPLERSKHAPARAREEGARSGRDPDLALRQRAEVAKKSYGRYRYTDDELQECINAGHLTVEEAIAAGAGSVRRIDQQGDLA